MIGNDVVDLKLASRQSDWRREGFLEKVFSVTEQHQILASKEPEKLVWLLWSMKEAAYKAHQRRFHLPRKINWQEFECSLTAVSDKSASGRVKAGKAEYITASEITEACLHTAAEIKDRNIVKNSIFETSSAEMKQLFLQQISEAFKVPKKALKIHKDLQGIPFVSFGTTTLFEDFSFSGHGRFCAFSMAVNDL